MPSQPELPRQLPDRMIRDSLQRAENLRDFLRDCVPTVADQFDYEKLEPVERGLLTGDWRLRESDLIFKIPYLDKEGLAALVLLLIEHQSDTDPFVPLRMLLAIAELWERVWRDWESKERPRPAFALPPVVPIVLYTGNVAWGSNRTIADLLGQPEILHPFAPAWGPVFWNLAERTPEQLLAGGPWMQLMTLMRVSGEEQAELERIFTAAVRRVNLIRDTDHVRWYDLLRMLLTYATWRRSRGEREALREIVERENPANHEEVKVMAQTAAEEYMLEAATKEAKASLRAVLEERFGPVPETLAQELQITNDLDRLRGAVRRAVRAASLAEFQL